MVERYVSILSLSFTLFDNRSSAYILILVKGVLSSWDTEETKEVFCLASFILLRVRRVKRIPPDIIAAIKIASKIVERYKKPFVEAKPLS